jgi:hypothetical protein
MSDTPVLLDIADMPGFNVDGPQNGIRSVTSGLIEWGTEDWSSYSIPTVRCTRHGATNCVAKLADGGSLWRCPTCNEGAYRP